MHGGWTSSEIHRNHLKLVERIQEDIVSILSHITTNKGKKSDRSKLAIQCQVHSAIILRLHNLWWDVSYAWTALQPADLVTLALLCNSRKKRKTQKQNKKNLTFPTPSPTAQYFFTLDGFLIGAHLWFIKPSSKMLEISRALYKMGRVNRQLTQQDGWKTQGGRKTTKCRVRHCIPNLTRIFSSFCRPRSCRHPVASS